MDDWAFQESSDSAMGTVNNVHLLWKFQTLDSLGLSEQRNDTTTNRPLQDNETSTFIPSEPNRAVPDDLQQDIDRILNMPTEGNRAKKNIYIEWNKRKKKEQQTR